MAGHHAVKPTLCRYRPIAALFAIGSLAACAAPSRAGARSVIVAAPHSATPAAATDTTSATPRAAAEPADPVLEPLSDGELAALRPLARRGAAILVRNADEGPRARITVLVRARAPLETVRRVIATPDEYPAFMPTISSVDVLSRRPNRIGFRFHVRAVIFDVSTLSSLHVVNDHRVDVAIVRSDIGPGASRWDLVPDGDGTLVALSTWGDPSRGTWLLRQVARRSPAAIAAMNISADVLLLLSATRRAEILAGLALPVRPAARIAPSGPLAPPARGAWTALARRATVASISLDAQGVITQSSVAAWSNDAPETLRARLDDVIQYGRYWSSIRDLRVTAERGPTRRFHITTEGAMLRTEGEIERTTEPPGPDGSAVIWWRGVAGDYAAQDHRWDVLPEGNGSVLVLTGGADYAQASTFTRAMVDRDPWLMPGFAASWKLVWMRPLLQGP